MLRKLLTYLAIPFVLSTNIYAQFGRGSSGASISSLLPIIADSTLLHKQGTTPDTVVVDGALPVKFSGMRVTGDTQLDGNLTMNTVASESLKVLAGGIRNEGGLRQKGAATFGATATPTVIGVAGEMDLGTTTDNSKMTVGLNINQGANDDAIIALKSSDVAHGMTGIAETDTYGYLTKSSGDYGGLKIVGFNDVSNIPAIDIQGFGTSNTTAPALRFVGYKKSGANETALASTDMLFSLVNNSTILSTMLGNGYFGIGTTAPAALLHANNANVLSKPLFRLGRDKDATPDSLAMSVTGSGKVSIAPTPADTTAKVTIKPLGVMNPLLVKTAGDTTALSVSTKAVVTIAKLTIGSSNFTTTKMDTVFTAGYVPRWVKFTSGAKTWYSPVYADTTGKW